LNYANGAAEELEVWKIQARAESGSVARRASKGYVDLGASLHHLSF
jgi:hypothetical protein